MLITVILLCHFATLTESDNRHHEFDELVVAEQCWRASEYNDLVTDSRLSQIHIVRQVVSAEDCDYITQEILDYVKVNGWTTARHNEKTATTDINTIVIDKLNNFIVNFTKNELFPKYTQFYDTPMELLTIYETFVVKYEFRDDVQSDLKPHVDGSEYSFVLALNHPEEYDGGGTRFIEKGKEVYKLNKGDIVIFPGKLYHEGVQVNKGKRFILAGFLKIISDNHCTEMLDRRSVTITNHRNTIVELYWDDGYDGFGEYIAEIPPGTWFRLDTYIKHHFFCNDDLCNFYIDLRKIYYDIW